MLGNVLTLAPSWRCWTEGPMPDLATDEHGREPQAVSRRALSKRSSQRLCQKSFARSKKFPLQ